MCFVLDFVRVFIGFFHGCCKAFFVKATRSQRFSHTEKNALETWPLSLVGINILQWSFLFESWNIEGLPNVWLTLKEDKRVLKLPFPSVGTSQKLPKRKRFLLSITPWSIPQVWDGAIYFKTLQSIAITQNVFSCFLLHPSTPVFSSRLKMG